MSKGSFFFLWFAGIVVLAACKKEPDPEEQARVTYEVVETSSSVPSFTVSYTGENSATETEGPISSSSWRSETIKDKKRGDFVSFTLDSNSGSGSFKMRIYMNGVLWMEETVDIPFTPKTISGNLPQ
jgi:hypothetical protein